MTYHQSVCTAMVFALVMHVKFTLKLLFGHLPGHLQNALFVLEALGE